MSTLSEHRSLWLAIEPHAQRVGRAIFHTCGGLAIISIAFVALYSVDLPAESPGEPAPHTVGFPVSSEMTDLWIPRALFERVRDRPQPGILTPSGALREALVSQQLGSAWFAIRYRYRLASGQFTTITQAGRIAQAPTRLDQLQLAVDDAAGRALPDPERAGAEPLAVHFLSEHLQQSRPLDVLPRLLEERDNPAERP